MPAKKHYKVDIDVVPYLSIMAIVLKLICLILIVMVMRIAVNPEALKICRYPQLYQPPEEAAPTRYVLQTNADGKVENVLLKQEKQISRTPVYFDCHPDRVEIHPEGLIIPVSELREPGGDFEMALQDIQANIKKKVAVLITRPNSAPVYRYVRRKAEERDLTVGFDLLGSEVIIDWPTNIHKFAVNTELLNATRQAKIYGIPVEVMTNWFNQAAMEKTHLSNIAARVKSGKAYDDAPARPVYEPKHH